MEEILEIFFGNICTFWFILQILTLVAISSAIYYVKSTSQQVKLPPGPPWIPLLGSIPWIDRANPFKTQKEWANLYGPIVMFYMGRRRSVLVNDAKLARELLIKHADVFSGRADIIPARINWGVKGGVVLENGEDWKRHRRWVVTGLRHFGMGKRSFEEQISTEAEKLCEQIGKKDGKFDPQKYVINAVSNIICSISFGKRYEYDDIKFQELLGNVNALFSSTVYGKIEGISAFLTRFGKRRQYVAKIIEFFNSHMKEHTKTFDKNNIRDLIDTIILQAKEEFENGKTDDLSSYTSKPVGMLSSSRSKSDIATDVNSLWRAILMLFLAGTDTTTNTIMWFLLYMVSYPAVQKRIQDEIDNVTNRERPLTIQDKLKVPYFEATICEVQRLGNIAPGLIPHCTTADFSINGYDIPANSYFNINLCVIHTDPNYWKDPHKFKPERFLDDDEKTLIKRDAFMPFGIGRRACLGDNLARMELYIFLSRLLEHFSFEVPVSSPMPGFEPNVGITLSPQYFQVIAKKR